MISLIIPALPGFDELNRECINAYQETASSEVEIILSEDKQPFAINVNNGIKLAKGDILCVVNNDSMGLPGWDAHIRGVLDKNPGIASFTTRADCGWAFAAKRNLWDAIGLLDENLCNSYEDYDFFIRAALRGYTRILAPKHFAVHSGGMTLQTLWGHNRQQSAQRLAQCKANRAYMQQKWPDLNIDAVPYLYWAIHGIDIMKEWSREHLENVEG